MNRAAGLLARSDTGVATQRAEQNATGSTGAAARSLEERLQRRQGEFRAAVEAEEAIRKKPKTPARWPS